MRSLLAALSLALAQLPLLAGAQATVHFEAGGTRVEYGDSARVTAGALSAAVNALGPNSSFSGTFGGSVTRESSWSLFSAASGSVFTSESRALRGEISGGGSFTTYGREAGSSHLLGGVRLHYVRNRAGAWLGTAGGGVRDPLGWRPTTSAELGVWTQLGAAVAQAIVMPVRVGGDIRYTDLEGTLRFDNARGELVAVVGSRTEVTGYAGARAWANVHATAWVLRTVGLTGGVGSYPADPGQGLPGARYVTLGVRVTPRAPRRSATMMSADVLSAASPSAPTVADAGALTVTDGPGTQKTVAVRVLSAQGVEIMGDFTDWEPVQMNRGQADGFWYVSLPLSSGVHQVNLRVDGGQWTAPPSLSTVRDEFGDSVGILLVP